VHRRRRRAPPGTVVKSTGDGVLATFDAPGRAVQAALALNDAVAEIGLSVRAGLHTSEIQQRGADITGIGVNLASRVTDAAPGGEVWVTRTVTDLVAGTGLRFEERGSHDLRASTGRERTPFAGDLGIIRPRRRVRAMLANRGGPLHDVVGHRHDAARACRCSRAPSRRCSTSPPTHRMVPKTELLDEIGAPSSRVGALEPHQVRTPGHRRQRCDYDSSGRHGASGSSAVEPTTAPPPTAR
jgi:hypothetical protein